MRLTDLDPRWLSETRFAFKCPHCREIWLTCQTEPTPMGKQCDENEAALGEDALYCPANPETKWAVSSRNFAEISVTPSIDASKAGHWHGFITNGEIA
jgi:hypothetical protein